MTALSSSRDRRFVLACKYVAKELGCAESALRVDESDAHEAGGGELVGRQVTTAIAACVQQLSRRLDAYRRLAPSSDPAAVFEFAVQKACVPPRATSHVDAFSAARCECLTCHTSHVDAFSAARCECLID